MDFQPDHRLIFLANSRRKLSERCHQEIIGQSGLTDSVYPNGGAEPVRPEQPRAAGLR